MGNRMQAYYRAQASVMSEVIVNEQTNVRAFCARHAAAGRLCLIGSGSSFYCAKMMEGFLSEASGLAVKTLLPGEAERFCPQADDLLLMITQEGKSVNVLRAADHFDSLGVRFSALTALPDSPTARRAEDCLCIGCGEERSGPKTKGVLATLTVLALLGLAWGACRGTLPQYDAGLRAMEGLASSVEENIRRSLDWALENEGFFTEASFVAVIGVSPLCVLGNEGALKLVETLYLPAASYEFEEFIHGPHCLIGERLHMIALYHGLPDEERLRALCAFAREKGAKVLEISDQEEAESFTGLRLVGGGIFPVSFLLPFQAASAYLAESMGHDLDRPKFPGFATRLKSKLY